MKQLHSMEFLEHNRYLKVASVCILLAYLLVELFYRRRGPPLPPLIPGYPLIGNIPQFAVADGRKAIHLLLGGWARREGCGDIFRVKLGPLTNYYLNSDVAVKEIIDKQSAYTSERPRWIFSNELLANQWNPLLLNGSDPRWKLQRKVAHQEMLSEKRADAGLAPLYFESIKFLHEAIHDPAAGTDDQDLWAQIGRYTYSAFAMQAFGFEIPTSTDPDINFIHESGLNQILGTLPLSRIVDVLPWLQHLPLFLKPWEREARAGFHEDLTWVRKRMQTVMSTGGDQTDAMLPRLLADKQMGGISSADEVGYLALELIVGAADTSKMSTMSFLEAMLMYPEVQRKAQQEIDLVVADRLPVWEDLEDIPYVRCLMKEIWRWRPPVALGHPHRTTRDLEFKGMMIPKGSRIHINSWAIHHDPKRHEDPDEFRPERYENDHTTTQQSINLGDPTKRDHFAFGAGRRVCPGYHVAERSLAIAIMRILWAFNVTPKPCAKIPLNPADYPGAMPGNPGANLPACLLPRHGDRVLLVNQYYVEELKRHEQVFPGNSRNPGLKSS